MAPNPNPFASFKELFERAREVVKDRDFNAMTVATVDEEGRPSARVVLLKGFDERGFVFYTNHQSRKGKQSLARPDVALVFYWPELEYQVRVEGRADKVTDAEADAYFQSRARESQLGAWASKQSETLPSRDVLLERVAQFEKKFAGVNVPRPPQWSGFRVVPIAIEFWKNEPSRLHQRTLYERPDARSSWTTRLLYP